MALARWEMMWAQGGSRPEEGWGLRRGQAQSQQLSGLPGLLGILALLLLGEAAAARSGLADSWLCWEWVGPKNPPALALPLNGNRETLEWSQSAASRG